LVPQFHAPLRLSLSNASATIVAFATDDSQAINAHPEDWCGQWLVVSGAELKASAACLRRKRAPTASTTFPTATPTFPTTAPTCASAALTYPTSVVDGGLATATPLHGLSGELKSYSVSCRSVAGERLEPCQPEPTVRM